MFKRVDGLTGLILAIYVISTTAFENFASTTWLASYSIYLFIFFALILAIMRGSVKFTYYNLITTAYGVFLALSLFWTKDFEYGSKTFYWYLTCAVLTFFVANYIDSEEKFYSVLNVYILAGIVLSFLLYIHYGWEIFSIAATSKYGIRLGGKIGNSNSIGISLSFAVCFALLMLANFKVGMNKRIFYLGSILINLPGLLLSGSKKALFVLIFGVVFVFLTSNTDKKIIAARTRGIFISGGLLFLIYWLLNNVAAFWYLNQRVNEMFATLAGEQASITDLTRINMIRLSLNEFSDAPLFGNGVAHSYVIFGTYSHNNYVEILMNTGIVGFMIFYASYLIAINKVLGVLKHNYKIAIISLFILSTLIFIEFGLVSYYSRYYQILLASISAVLGLQFDRTILPEVQSLSIPENNTNLKWNSLVQQKRKISKE